MQIKPLAKLVTGIAALALLASAVAIGAVAPVSVRPAPDGAPTAQTPESPPVRSAQAGAAAPPAGYTPSEEISADKSVSFPADI